MIHDPHGAAHRRYGAGSECLFLVRPDGYVGYRSQPALLDPLMEYLGRVLLRRTLFPSASGADESIQRMHAPGRRVELFVRVVEPEALERAPRCELTPPEAMS